MTPEPLPAAEPAPPWGPPPERARVLANVFTYAGQVGGHVFGYVCRLIPEMIDHPRIDHAEVSRTLGYPTDRVRNFACKKARDDGFTHLFMLDDDMVPDLLVGSEPQAQRFLTSSLDFMLDREAPCLVGAPYCSTPPAQEVVVMKTRAYWPDLPDGLGHKLDKYTRDEAAVETGIKPVAALPTGCLLIDLRALAVVDPPWFAYEYKDPPWNTELASSEDVVFTRNAHWLGVEQFCNWDAWAGHDKRFVTGKPRLAPIDSVPAAVWNSFERGWRPPFARNGAARQPQSHSGG